MKEIIVNEELKKEILHDMPEGLSKTQQAIYVYIKMCKLLTYDDKYWVSTEEEKSVEQKKISNVQNITLTNNKVVCFEFAAILAKILEKLGIKVQVKHSPENNEYGEFHDNVTVVIDKNIYLPNRYKQYRYEVIEFDPLLKILYGDMANAKMNTSLTGIRGDVKQEDINEIYDLIMQQEKSNTFAKTIEKYKGYASPGSKVPLDTKIKLFLEKIKDAKMPNIDLYSYMLTLRNIMFTKEEIQKNINIVIIRNNENCSRMANAIIIINSSCKGFESKNVENKYYMYQERSRITKHDEGYNKTKIFK